MKIIVITGSTRGIGYALANAFLQRGCSVMLNGRTKEAVEKAVSQLGTVYGNERVDGCPGSSTNIEDLQHVWNTALARFGRIDIWINNAGIAHPLQTPWEMSEEQMRCVLETNLLGAMYGTKVALRSMLTQGFGALYNTEGYGSSGSGMKVKGLAFYGTSKAGLRFFNDAVMKEVEGTPLIVGALQPGMVVTEMLTGQYQSKPEELEKVKRIFNIIADRPEIVAPWLAQRVLDNTKNGVRFQFSSTLKISWRFLTAPFSKRDLFKD
jgi:NAD(P)-dependent dehydrogenase (short-subunit alcohol dehydrogenase family)